MVFPVWVFHLGPKFRHLSHVSYRTSLRAGVPGGLDQVWACCINVLICCCCLLELHLKDLILGVLVLFLDFPDGFARRADRRGFGGLFDRIDLVFLETGALLEI